MVILVFLSALSALVVLFFCQIYITHKVNKHLLTLNWNYFRNRADTVYFPVVLVDTTVPFPEFFLFTEFPSIL